jgi:hypothetical protein
MSTPRLCQFCGKPTEKEKFDYLEEADHTECVVRFEHEQSKQLELLFPSIKVLMVEVNVIENTSNDQELGAKVRKLYHEVYNNG